MEQLPNNIAPFAKGLGLITGDSAGQIQIHLRSNIGREEPLKVKINNMIGLRSEALNCHSYAYQNERNQEVVGPYSLFRKTLHLEGDPYGKK